jgi:hypothetical protein
VLTAQVSSTRWSQSSSVSNRRRVAIDCACGQRHDPFDRQPGLGERRHIARGGVLAVDPDGEMVGFRELRLEPCDRLGGGPVGAVQDDAVPPPVRRVGRGSHDHVVTAILDLAAAEPQ